MFYDTSNRWQINNWSTWHVQVSMALWLARILLECVSYTLVKLNMPGTDISLEAELNIYLSGKAADFL